MNDPFSKGQIYNLHEGAGDGILVREFPLRCEMPPDRYTTVVPTWSSMYLRLTRSRLRHADRWYAYDENDPRMAGVAMANHALMTRWRNR